MRRSDGNVEKWYFNQYQLPITVKSTVPISHDLQGMRRERETVSLVPIVTSVPRARTLLVSGLEEDIAGFLRAWLGQ